VNLFATSLNPTESAQALDDKRVGKMLMECCQMLSVAAKMWWPIEDQDFIPLYESSDAFTRGMAYKNHPCTIWVRSSRANYDWTIAHAWALLDEYIYRFGKSHASGDRLMFLEKQRDCVIDGELLPFANCARNAGRGVDFTHLPVHEAYRAYLTERWKTDIRPVTFTKRGEPAWRNLQWQE
jgi:hypothetical protein